MSKVDELRQKLKKNDGCGCCSKWRDTEEMLSCVDDLIQASQDEVWELIEKVMRKTQYETITKGGDMRYHHRFHIDTPDGLMSFKEAIFAAAKELEKE